MDDELLNVKCYPEAMYMDVYGNGHRNWDRDKHKNITDVDFRVKYIRFDLVHDRVHDALYPPKQTEEKK